MLADLWAAKMAIWVVGPVNGCDGALARNGMPKRAFWKRLNMQVSEEVSVRKKHDDNNLPHVDVANAPR